MSCKRRLRRKSCTRKKRHDTKEQAHALLHYMKKYRGYNGKVYHCKFCNGWHIGRTPKKNKIYKKLRDGK